MSPPIDPEFLDDYVVVPANEISEEALEGLITAHVTREGTDYGERELAFETKANQLRQQLRTGQVLIVYHLPSEDIGLFRKEDVPSALRLPSP